MADGHKYIVITPAKDEAGFIERTIQSMLHQTVLPVCWVIVDDGSSDQTPQILESYRNALDWLRVIRIERNAERKLGTTEIRAFETGFRSVADKEFDFVVKLDCDLEFGPNYFEQLIARFAADPSLGIASGVYLEKKEHEWSEVIMPPYHASGASKIVRRKCFSDIGGFALSPGWDTADEIKAQIRGWGTRHFPDIQFYHLKPEGSANGSVSTGILHGRVYYVTGGGLSFFLLKFLHRLVFGRPRVLGGLSMLWGYLRSWASGTERLVTDDEAKFYRHQLNKRVVEGIRKSLAPGKITGSAHGAN
jgi:poly-beta-1,6-N-acetyl-D-glucosamine synthase